MTFQRAICRPLIHAAIEHALHNTDPLSVKLRTIAELETTILQLWDGSPLSVKPVIFMTPEDLTH